MIRDSIMDCVGSTPMITLRRLFPDPDLRVLAKLEFLNPGGSVKDRPARHIVEHGLASGAITREHHLVESTSGNFGVALAMAARLHSLRFTAVVDPDISPTNLAIIRQLGATVDMVSDDGTEGGHLMARLDRVRRILDADPRALWVNQYANRLNLDAHFHTTGTEIAAEVDGPIDCLVLAVSTAGTIMGTARRLRQDHPNLRVVAVDVVGSVLFGGPPSPRRLPGIGAGRRPELLDLPEIDRVVHVTEQETIGGCRDLLGTEAVLAGASSGSIVAAIGKLLPVLPRPACVVTLLPDRGERYLDSVYLP